MPDQRLRLSVEFGKVHLSTDQRVNLARSLVEGNRFPEALEILKPLAQEDRPDQTDVRFLLGLAASRRSQDRRVGDDEREALLDEAIAAFRSILIKRPGTGARAPGTGPGLLSERRGPVGPRAFRAGSGGAAAQGLVTNINRFLNIMRARRRWTGYFGFSLCSGYQHHRGLGRGYHLYQRAALPPESAAGQFGDRHRGMGRRGIPIPVGPALALAHGGQRQSPGL